jgi:ubiquinone/menaquinone biosynthesis C-methylase UbiE
MTQDAHYVPALGFRWLTPVYDAVVAATTRERRFKTALIEQARIGADDRVLDLACGTGTLAVWVKQRHPSARVTGLDGDNAVLSIARRKARNAATDVNFDQGLSTRLPYANGSFDRVLCSLFFHHLSWRDKQVTAREIHRVLRPGGQLHVADWGPASGPLTRAAFLAVQMLDGFANTRDDAQGRLIELFRGAAFSAVTPQSSFDTLFGTMVLYRAVKPRRCVDRAQASGGRAAYASEESRHFLGSQ